MKKQVIICLASLGFLTQGMAQAQQNEAAPSILRIGAGYFGENFTHPGLFLEFEYGRAYTPELSLPLRASLGYHVNEGYHAYFLDLHKGFRKSFSSGLFLEQSLGAGVLLKQYRSDWWYYDKYFNVIPHGNQAVMSFMPSVTFGAGYDLSREKDASSMIWVRPKLYWDMGFRMLHQPYFALQLGYSHTLKSF